MCFKCFDFYPLHKNHVGCTEGVCCEAWKSFQGWRHFIWDLHGINSEKYGNCVSDWIAIDHSEKHDVLSWKLWGILI